MVDEGVGHRQGAHLEAAIEQPGFGEMLQHVAAEAADRALLDRHQDLVLLGETADQIAVERLHEARIGNGRRKAHGRELVGGLQCLGQARAEREDGDGGPFPDDAALADRERHALLGPFQAHALAARIAEG